MKGIANFKKDLVYGKKYEQLALQYLEEFSKVEFAPDGYFPEWDLKVLHINEHTWTKYEVKADRMVCKTGNFFIETGNKQGNNSGLRLTDSDYYVLISTDVGDNIIETYIVPTDTLRKYDKDGLFVRVSKPVNGFLLPKTILDKEIAMVEINAMV